MLSLKGDLKTMKRQEALTLVREGNPAGRVTFAHEVQQQLVKALVSVPSRRILKSPSSSARTRRGSLNPWVLAVT
ncbi:hypothetical protein V2O64_17185 [Verrucomicrobiaceae bacterium 227]